MEKLRFIHVHDTKYTLTAKSWHVTDHPWTHCQTILAPLYLAGVWVGMLWTPISPRDTILTTRQLPPAACPPCPGSVWDLSPIIRLADSSSQSQLACSMPSLPWKPHLVFDDASAFKRIWTFTKFTSIDQCTLS